MKNKREWIIPPEHQKRKDYTVRLVFILGGCLLFGLTWYFIHGLVESIETVGLKAIWEQIWCGKSGCYE